MSRPPAEHPTIVREGDSSSLETHPAFGQIGASRVTGHAYLYGSDFSHQHYVTVRISGSELKRSLSNDWPHPTRELIEVSLSEAQWATFVSSLNCGSGVQCTISHIGMKQMPEIAAPKDRRHQIKTEADETMADGMAALKRLRAKINEMKVSQKQKDILLGALDTAERELNQNLPFVAEQFAEHIENVTEHAKIEVNAYIQSAIVRAGMKSLQDSSPIALPE